MKKVISLILTAALLVTLLPTTAFAAKKGDKDKWDDDSAYVSTIEEAGALLREELVDHEDNITIYYKIPGDKTFDSALIHQLGKDIFNEAVKHTGNPKEGDSLRFAISGYKVYASAKAKDGAYWTTLDFGVTYYTTKQQEAKLDQEIVKLKKQLDIDGMSTYEQVKAIHDYMCDNIDYDYEGSRDESDKLCHTAYAALIKGKAVCQGYATLFYRLALEYGIDARIISGVSLGESHGWNIVKIGDMYYNLDATWDSTTKTNKYFLKGSQDFADYTRDAEYSSSAFTKAYPMSKKSYQVVCTNHVKQTVTTAATTKADGKIKTSCANCGAVLSTKKICKISSVKLDYQSYVYSGKTKTPKIIVKDSSGKTISSSNYTVKKASGRKNVGKYSYVVTFKGNYEGSKTLTFTINPQSPTIQKPVAAKKAITVKWKKVSSQATGYQIMIATDKKFTKNKQTIWVKSSKTTSRKITGLRAKTTYYVKVRTYKTVSGKNYYSAWSSVQSLKTK